MNRVLKNFISSQKFVNSLQDTKYYGTKGFIAPNNLNQEGLMNELTPIQRAMIERKAKKFLVNTINSGV